VQELAAGAVYAGDAQPYKVDEDDDEDGAQDDEEDEEPALRAAAGR
jgi:ribosome-binding factor A